MPWPKPSSPSACALQYQVSVDDVRQLMGASTPHFALQLRNRIRTLIARLPPEDPARRLGEQEIARLERLGVTGEIRGEGFQDGQRPLPSLARRLTARVAAAPASDSRRTVRVRRGATRRGVRRPDAAGRRAPLPRAVSASRIARTTLRAASACGPRPADALRAIRRSSAYVAGHAAKHARGRGRPDARD